MTTPFTIFSALTHSGPLPEGVVSCLRLHHKQSRDTDCGLAAAGWPGVFFDGRICISATFCDGPNAGRSAKAADLEVRIRRVRSKSPQARIMLHLPTPTGGESAAKLVAASTALGTYHDAFVTVCNVSRGAICPHIAAVAGEFSEDLHRRAIAMVDFLRDSVEPAIGAKFQFTYAPAISLPESASHAAALISGLKAVGCVGALVYDTPVFAEDGWDKAIQQLGWLTAEAAK